MDQLTRELLEMLECHVCLESLTRPIYRCKSEHLMCEECFQRLSKCPSCRAALRKRLRSRSMEQVADIVRQHKRICTFRPDASDAQCPLVYSCHWQGSRAAVEQHVRLDHSDELVAAPDGAFAAAASSATVLEFDSALFVVRAESVTVADFTSHYVHVGHVAQGLRAAKTRYRFKVRRQPRGVFYKGPVTDYRQPLQELAAAGGCLFFVSQVDKIDEVSYTGTIKKFPL